MQKKWGKVEKNSKKALKKAKERALRILQGNPLQKKWGKVKKTAKRPSKKAKERALRILQSTPLQKKRSKVEKNSQKLSKKAKARAFESDAGKSLRSRKARQKTLGGKARRLSLPPKNKRDAGKASLRLGLLGSHVRAHRAIGFEASKSSQNRHVFRLHGRFVTQQASVAAVLPRIWLCTRLLIRSTAHRPRVRPHVPAV